VKVAFYIEDGLEQIVLTPESDHEVDIMKKMHDGTRELQIHRGEFYACQGGWTRQRKRYPSSYGSEPEENSTIVVLRRKTEASE